MNEEAQEAGLGDWHSGLGVVLECEFAPWNQTQCSGNQLTVSGASKLGFYPFVSNSPSQHFVLIARATQVDYFNSTHALAMTVSGATCFTHATGPCQVGVRLPTLENRSKPDTLTGGLAGEATRLSHGFIIAGKP